MTFDEELTLLSTKCRDYIRSGHISMYSKTLKEIADLFLRNDRRKDQLKMLTFAFYIDLSGFGCASYIDRTSIENIVQALRREKMDLAEFERLYFSWIQPDMISQHLLSVKDCWYLMNLCVQGKTDQAEYILSKL